MKNPNGYGGVIKLPGRRRNPWAARVTTGWDDEGKQIFRYIGYAETKRDALGILAAHQVKPVAPRADLTLEELYKEWTLSITSDIGAKTAEGYRGAWRYLAQHAKEKVKDYRTAHVDLVLKQCQKAGLSASLMSKIRSLAAQMLDKAVSQDIVEKNYARLAKIPKTEKTERQRFSDLEIKKLWKAQDTPWVDTILILIYSGMRLGEMLTLTRFAIDWEQATITGGIKTDAGKNRVIPIHPRIAPLLRRWDSLGGERLINKDGKAMSLDYYRKYCYYKALETAGVPKLNPHCCRHTFASMMADAGADVVAIQQIIGHAKYSTTADIYTHKDIQNLSQAICKI